MMSKLWPHLAVLSLAKTLDNTQAIILHVIVFICLTKPLNIHNMGEVSGFNNWQW